MKEATYQMSECSEKVHAKVSRDKEVISPASYVVILFVCEVMDHNTRRSRTKKSATSEAPTTGQPRDGGDRAHVEDGTQFFRRIRVICMRSGDGNSSYDDGGTQFFPNICIDVIECVDLFV